MLSSGPENHCIYITAIYIESPAVSRFLKVTLHETILNDDFECNTA